MATHTVQAGDTLYGIARNNGLTLQELLDENPSISNPSHIQVGDKINIPSGAFTTVSIDPNDVDVMARTIMGEARGEPEQGKIAVGWVIINRAKSGKWFGGNGDIFAVCRRPFQFSCWNPGDPNLSVITKAKAGDSVFDLCIDSAQKVLTQSVSDPTKGATHYYANSILQPAWAKSPALFTVQIGAHLFYNNVS